MTDRSSPSLRLQILLVCALLGAYLLILPPAPESADGNALAAVAVSWVRSGSPNMNAVVYADYYMPTMMARMGSVGVDGAVYAKKGVTPSIFLMPLVVLSDALPWLPTRTTLMLFNPLVTAVTALLLLRFVVALDFRPRTGLVVGLAYGLATIAFAYAKTLFGEPLAGWLLLVAVAALYRGRMPRDPLIAGAALGLLVGINTVYTVFVPVFGLLLLLRWRDFRSVIYMGIPLAVAVLLLGLYNAARFGDPLNGGYRLADGEGFTVPFGVGMYGLFASPYRGIFWYSPLLLLALPGWWMLHKAQRWLAGVIVVLVLLQGAAFASWWSWHGGVVWGPRFLLPVVPLLALALAPLVEAMWTRRHLMLVVGVFAALSGFIACLGAFYSYFPYIERYLNTRYVINDWRLLSGYRDEVLLDPTLSPIIGHLAMLVGGVTPEPGWINVGDWAYLLIPAGLVTFGVAQLLVTMTRRVRLVLAAAVTVIALQAAVARQADQAAGNALASLQPFGTIVAETDVLGSALLDARQHVPAITITAPSTPDDPEMRALWDYARRQRDKLWLLTWFPPGDVQNWQERDLWQSAAFVTERSILDHRALLFALGADPPEQTGGWMFGDMRLDSYGVAVQPDGVQVLLRWTAGARLDHLTWFVHLIDASGAIVAQQDRQPQGGYAPTETWVAGQVVTDRLLLLANAPDPQTWRLRVGWVEPQTGTLLPATDSAGKPLPEAFVMLPLE